MHNGTVVTFQPSIGSVNPPEARTVNGVARATFLAGSASGTGVVHAFSGPARTGSGNTSGGGVTVKVGTAAAFGAIAVSASPSSVSQSGGTVTVSATVFDEATNPLPGVNVQFTTSSGTLSQTTATTDSNGIARTQLTTTQTATVTAIAGAAKGETRVDVSTAPTVAIDLTSPAIAGAPTPITVNLSGGSGNTSPRQIQTLTVDFGDGNVETRTNVTGSVAFTHVYSREGGYTVTARAVDVAGNTGVVSRPIVVNRSQPGVTLTVPATLDYSDTSGVAGITVAATAAAGQPPIQSVVVRLGDGTVIYSGSSGASFTYQFAGPGTYAVNATATDTAGGVGTASGVVRVVP